MKNRHVSLLDYGIGNVLSVCRALEKAGGNVTLCQKAEDIQHADRLVLPGVGAFGDCKASLQSQGMIDPILDFVASGRPFFGICVGMQLILREGLEFGTHAGLSLIDGRVEPISSNGAAVDQDFKIPHIGWSKLTPGLASHLDAWYTASLSEEDREKWFYFVHSYSANPVEAENIAAYVDYQGVKITAAIAKENIFGTQFHPEKSGVDGLRLLQRFLEN